MRGIGAAVNHKKDSSASRNSSMVWKRLFLSTAMAFMTRSDRLGGRAGFASIGGRARPCP